DDLFAEMIQKTLIRFGYEVVRARNGKEALELYDPQKVDLVLTDLIMPDKEGLELITELHRSHAGIKIIAMSGGGRNNPLAFLKAAEKFGATKILAKPFPQEALATAVRECLEKPQEPA
ncbi:MAG: response regulator, partial [Verrucomicrobia bacterium]|nr:response regulator [Verrucomicrobiota bacterium]